MSQAYAALGRLVYYLLLPLLYVYGRTAKPRPRLLLIHNNQALLVKNWLSQQLWTLPGGGVMGSESETDALCREIHEELGLEVYPHELTHLQNMTVRRIAPYTISIYVLKLHDSPAPLAIDTREIVAAMWCPLHELPLGSSSELQEIVQRYSE